jgi:hypothetical protein
MGVTIQPLAERTIGSKAIFNNRMVVELCETAHIHYRNLRIVQPLDDFINIAEGFVASLDRWKKRGCPGTGAGQHIELCRKKVAVSDNDDKIQINLNDNLYRKNEGGIFAEGADFQDEKYIHVKIRNIRLEFSLEEFNQIAEAFKEAQEKLNVPV